MSRISRGEWQLGHVRIREWGLGLEAWRGACWGKAGHDGAGEAAGHGFSSPLSVRARIFRRADSCRVASRATWAQREKLLGLERSYTELGRGG